MTRGAFRKRVIPPVSGSCALCGASGSLEVNPYTGEATCRGAVACSARARLARQAEVARGSVLRAQADAVLGQTWSLPA